MKKVLVILGLVVLFFLLSFVSVYYFVKRPALVVNKLSPPKFVKADFIELDKTFSVSKFRSGAGHDFSMGGETCRSMKHYFMPQMDDAPSNSRNNGLPSPPNGKDDISIFSPVEGKILSISEEQTPIGKQVAILPDSAAGYRVRLFHIYLEDRIRSGTKVKAGEKIGVIGAFQGTDIAIETNSILSGGKFVSYFDVMEDSVFENYKKRGVKDKTDLIVSKEERDANPLQCLGGREEKFANRDQGLDNGDYFYLSGYKSQGSRIQE